MASNASGIRKMATIAWAKLAVLSLGLAPLPAQAEELPTFRHGLWELNRTMDRGGGKSVTSRRCTEPGEDMRRQNAMFEKAGCKVSQISRRGNVYSFAADCKGSGMGNVVSQSVITVESDAAYVVEIESSGDVGPGGPGAAKRHETLEARRVGDCH
jgi:hypothetical protein